MELLVPVSDLVERLEALVLKAEEAGLRVDGLHLPRAFVTEAILKKLEALCFNPKSLGEISKKVSRIEFITDGPLPMELSQEPAMKHEPVFKQTIGYGICKACRLCIQVCPKHVYKDDGFGRPMRDEQREEECTGDFQCGQCAAVCPENTIHLTLAEPVFKATLFILLENPYEAKAEGEGKKLDFFVANPLEAELALSISKKVEAKDLLAYHRELDRVHFYPILTLRGYARQFVDSQDPTGDLKLWAKENGRSERLVFEAIEILYGELPKLSKLKGGKYQLDDILHRIVDEILHAELEIGGAGARALLLNIVNEALIDDLFLGAKARPIGGILPPSTSLAWKTPYGEQVPRYSHMEKCLGPECGLCVTQCPEGGGGSNSAIRMVSKVPEGTIASLVRGFTVHLLKLDGSHLKTSDIEDLTGQRPFVFEVDADYCKSCGICITCCPHDVIESTPRLFEL